MTTLRILPLDKPFRPSTSHIYPPFKKGRYMEEYVYEYFVTHQKDIYTELVYIPIFWTNLQNHPGFSRMKENYQFLLQRAIDAWPKNAKFFTIVQHDDGPQLTLPKDTIVFGACTGTIPLPLIYEDTTNYLQSLPRLSEKPILASFVGTCTTHPVREELYQQLNHKENIVCYTKRDWTPNVAKTDADVFVDTTLQSKFCLAPRGYGRSSFRFFEAMLLDTVPVYIWDDVEWLPYKDQLDYSTFSVSIHRNEIHRLEGILRSISDEKYQFMVEQLQKIRRYFTLEGMCEYIVDYLERSGHCF